MARTGIGDAELARRVGVSRLTLVRWKEGVTSRPRHREDVVRLAELLRLEQEERDELLLTAGFSPENAQAAAEAPLPERIEEEAETSEPTEAAPAPQTQTVPLWQRKWPRIAGAALAVLLAVLTGVLAALLVGGPGFPEAAEDESLIVMAPFVNYTGGQQGFNVRGRLKHQIDREVLAAGLEQVRTVEWPEEIDGEDAALEAGLKSGATIVIWGEYDSGRVIATFTIPKSHAGTHDQQVVDLASSPAELPATVNVALTEEVRHVALLTLGQLYLEQRAYDKAKAVLIHAMAQPPADPQALAGLRFRLGHAYLGGELVDLDEAITLFTQVLAVQPRLVDVYNSRAVAYLDRGRPDDVDRALADLTRAAAIEAENPTTHLILAIAYRERGQTGDLDRAVSELTKSMSIRPDYAGAYVNRALVYMDRGETGDLDRAFGDLERALDLDPELSKAFHNRGVAYLARGFVDDYDRAVDDFGRAIELAPESAMAYFSRGLVYSLLEDLQRSLDDLRRAQELSPDEIKFNTTLCWQLGVTGKPQEALPYCNLAVDADPSGASSDSRGLVYAVMGRTDDAINDFEAFLAWVDRSPKETCRERYAPSRLAWIEALKAGEDPFDAATLYMMHVSPSTSREDPC